MGVVVVGLKVLTTSALTSARRCKRLHHLQYELGYRPVQTAEALSFGTLVHQGLEQWWRQRQAEPDYPQVWIDSARTAVHVQSCNPFDIAKADAMLNAYHAYWGNEEMRVLAVEREFKTPLINPHTGRASKTWVLCGKIDAIVELPDGRIVIVEHKTSSQDISPGADYWKLLRIDGQVTMYYLGAKSLKFDVEGCLYDVLVKPGQKPLKANTKRAEDETPEEYMARCFEAMAKDLPGYFAREMVVRLEEEERDGLYDIWQTAAEIYEGQKAGRAPRNPKACFDYHRPCDFWTVCAGEASLDDPTRFRLIENVNPELSPAVQDGMQEGV